MTKLITEGKFYSLPRLKNYSNIKILDEDTLIKRTIYGDPNFLKELSKIIIHTIDKNAIELYNVSWSDLNFTKLHNFTFSNFFGAKKCLNSTLLTTL